MTKTHTNVLAFNKICGFGKVILKKNMKPYLYSPLMLVGLLAILLSSNIFQLYKKCMSIYQNVNITIYVVSNDFQIIYMPI